MTAARSGQRLQWLVGRAHQDVLRRRRDAVTLDQLEDSRRPILFSQLPRMLRRDGTTPESLQGAFGYVDQSRGGATSTVVSSGRWRRAVAMSRTLAARRAARDRDT